MMLRFTVILPLVLSIAGFVLAMLSIFAGSKPGYMEEYHIVSLNMSSLGKDLVPTTTSGGSPTSTSTGGGIGGFFSSVVASATAAAGDILNDIEDDIADKLAAELGISQWYSLHLMDACEGNFAPNATDPNSWYNVTNCTAQKGGYQFNLTEVLDHELSIGPLDLNLADLQFPDEIQQAIDLLNGLLLGTFVLYCLGAGFSGLAILFCLLAFFTEPLKRVVLSNGLIAGLAALTLLIGSIITTVGSNKAVEKINEYGGKIGISANEGKNYRIISWVAFGVMGAALLFWIVDFFAGHRKRHAGNAGSSRWRRNRGDRNAGTIPSNV